MGGYGSGRTSKRGRKARNKMFVEWFPYVSSFKCMTAKIAKENGHTLTAIGDVKLLVTKDMLSIYQKNDSFKTGPMFSSPMQSVKGGFGERYYFRCPYCSTRTSRLYFCRYLACRKCHNLAYFTQNMSNEDRWLTKRRRLIDAYGITFEEASRACKPKWKHRRTFDGVIKEFDYLTEVATKIHLNRFEFQNTLAEYKLAKNNTFFR